MFRGLAEKRKLTLTEPFRLAGTRAEPAISGS